MADFSKFATLVARRFAELSQHELFVVDLTGDRMWELYLAAFPEGTNPIYRQRTEHDCSCCKQFIRNIGNVVAVIDGRRRSVWEIVGAEEPYAAVAEFLDEAVTSQPIKDLFRADQPKYGAEHTLEGLESGDVKKWHHFHGSVAARHQSKECAKVSGDYRTTVEVFKRGLTEITAEALATTIDLIESNNLYRGAEFLQQVKGFRDMQAAFNEAPSAGDFVWVNASSSLARFRNTAIGTLLTDLSSGVDVEAAVKLFEAKVAPENYKRPTAVITQRMVEDAMKVIDELGLEPALARRFARMSDITINNVLWADNDAKARMKGGLESLLMDATAPKKLVADNAEDIGIDDFMVKVLPLAQSMDLLFKNAHAGNLMTLTAPVHDDVAPLFKWGNNFGWSYNGNIADSAMRQAVQARGGRVDGVFRFTHSWNHPGRRNGSLMDLHVFMPGSNITPGDRIGDSYGNGERVGWNHRSHSKSGGVQDVDFTSIAPLDYIPVENITFPDLARMPEGRYVCKIHNWQFRSPTEAGFKAEIEFGGQLFEYDFPRALKRKEWVTVAVVTLKKGVFTIEHHIPSTASSQDLWGIKSETPVKVSTVMLSPNHWDDHAVGNKHWFFVLDGCKTDEPMRGIYNEFLRGDLEQHRKVFEVLGAKTKCEPTPEQLSGVGFSSTRGDKVTVAVSTQRGRKLYNINF